MYIHVLPIPMLTMVYKFEDDELERSSGIVINFFHHSLIFACGLEIYKLNLKSTS